MYGLGIDLKAIEEKKYEIVFDLKEISKSERLLFKILRLLFQKPGSDYFYPNFGCGIEYLKQNQSPQTIALVTERIYKIKNWLKEYETLFPEKEKEAKLKNLDIKSIYLDYNSLTIELKVETEANTFEIKATI